MTTRIVSAALGAWALATLPAHGQGSAGPQFCSHGEPAPACRTFPVLETGAGHRSQGRGRGALDLSWQAGVLSNRGRSAVGATFFAAAVIDFQRPSVTSRLGVLPRYRRWLGRFTSLDLAIGPVLELPERSRSRVGVTAEAAIGWPNDIALTGRVDLARDGAAWVGGVKLGSNNAGTAMEAEAVGLAVYGLIALVTWVGEIWNWHWIGNN